MRKVAVFVCFHRPIVGFGKSTHEEHYKHYQQYRKDYGPIAHKIPPNLPIFSFQRTFFQLAESASVLLGLYNKRQHKACIIYYKVFISKCQLK